MHDLARSLARALKESPENKAFQAARNKVKADKQAEKLIVEFRQKQFELAALQAQGKKPDPQQVKAAEALAQQLQKHPVVSEYFQAEVKFGQLWSDIQRILCEAVGVEVPKQP